METPWTFPVKISKVHGLGMTHCGACHRNLIGRPAIRPFKGPLVDALFCDQPCADRAHAPVDDPEDQWR